MDNPEEGIQEDDLGGTGIADKPTMIEEMRTAGVSALTKATRALRAAAGPGSGRAGRWCLRSTLIA